MNGLLNLPTFYANERQITEIPQWEVGGEYKMMVTVRQKSASQADDGEMSAAFEIVSYDVIGQEAVSEEEHAKGLRRKK